ncbi:MAG: SUMF1/EgtB/PvdO family nonheme iron enzyme [Nitrospirae bacterium]|nr:SUMF1/EgtB/PvdO family nonheme iron enzyme [Nitrospirota bacterium]
MFKTTETLIGALLIIFIAAFTLPSFGSEKKPKQILADRYIAVFDLAAVGVEKRIARQLTENLRRDLVLSNRYKVLNRSSMNKIIEEQKFKTSGCAAGACMIEAGRILGVRTIVTGSVSIGKNAYTIKLSLINTETGKLDMAYEGRCECGVDELLKSTKKLVAKMLDETPQIYEEPEKVVKVWLAMKNGTKAEMIFNGFNTKCGGYKDGGIRYATKEKTVDLPWKEIKYIIPASGKGMLTNDNEFQTDSLKPSHCTDAVIIEKTIRKITVQGHEKDVHEDIRASISDIRIIAFAQEWLEDAIKKEQQETEKLAGEFVFVRGGCFQMGDTFGDGDNDEKPAHEVCVDDFHIGKYEVTQGQWKAVMGVNPSYFKNCGDSCPIEQVSWNDTQEFIRKLNEKSGDDNYRLPTEAEWEYAARSGGRPEKYSGGSDIESVAWYSYNSGNKTYPVGIKLPNGLGIYDMTGNVLEWCQDWYSENYYSESLRNNPTGPSTGQSRILRGGSWGFNARTSRTTFRHWHLPTYGYFVGFRLAKPSK